MDPIYVQDKHFEKVDFKLKELSETGNYFEDCYFKQCNFSKTPLNHLRFFDCMFVNCDLSLSHMDETVWQNVSFKDCKMLGLHFENCNSFGWEVKFEGCQLDHSSFYGMKLNKQTFLTCELKEVDFSNAVLTDVNFSYCNMENGKLVGCDLQKADFSTAYNYSMDPELNKLVKAKFSQDGLSGLLTKYKIIIV